MNSKEADDGKKPKFGKLMPNQLTVFQHPDAPFLKISINSTPTKSKDERATARTSLRTPRPTTPTGDIKSKAGSLFPPRDLSKSRSLSPARNRPPQLPTGQPMNTEKQMPTQKKSFVDNGAAKLYEKATELRSSLDVPTFRVPIVREKSPDSISLPSSPMNSRKIGLSYLTPPTGRKLGSCVSPSHLAKKNDKDMISATMHTAPVQQANKPFTFQLCAPDHPASNPSSRAPSPGPFTSVLKSGSLSDESANKSFHSDFKERGGDRISRFDGYRSSGGLSPHDGSSSQGDIKKRGVSPTPLGNLKIAKECKESGINSSDKVGATIKPVKDEGDTNRLTPGASKTNGTTSDNSSQADKAGRHHTKTKEPGSRPPGEDSKGKTPKMPLPDFGKKSQKPSSHSGSDGFDCEF